MSTDIVNLTGISYVQGLIADLVNILRRFVLNVFFVYLKVSSCA